MTYRLLGQIIFTSGRSEVHQEEQGAVRVLDRRPERQETTTGGVTAEDAEAPQHCEGMPNIVKVWAAENFRYTNYQQWLLIVKGK